MEKRKKKWGGTRGVSGSMQYFGKERVTELCDTLERAEGWVLGRQGHVSWSKLQAEFSMTSARVTVFVNLNKEKKNHHFILLNSFLLNLFSLILLSNYFLFLYQKKKKKNTFFSSSSLSHVSLPLPSFFYVLSIFHIFLSLALIYFIFTFSLNFYIKLN